MINHATESQSDCKDHQCFQNGCNRVDSMLIIVNPFTARVFVCAMMAGIVKCR